MTNLQRATISIKKGLRKLVSNGPKGKFFFQRIDRTHSKKGKVDPAAVVVIDALKQKGLLKTVTNRGVEHQKAIKASFESLQGLKAYYKSKSANKKLIAAVSKKLDTKTLARKLLDIRNKKKADARRKK